MYSEGIFALTLSSNFTSASFTPTCGVYNITYFNNNLAPQGWGIVMGLAASSNAHSDHPYNYSGDNYQWLVACNWVPPATSNPLNCSSFNNTYYSPYYNVSADKIAGLTPYNVGDNYNTTNAHAEVTQNSNYTVGACYQGLQCISSTTGCNSKFNINIFNLSSTTNAHIGTGSGFGVAICCQYIGVFGTLPTSCNLTSATWSYTSAVQGEQVSAVVNGTNCAGQLVNFNVFDAKNGLPAYQTIGDTSFPTSGGPLIASWSVPYSSNSSYNNTYEFNATLAYLGTTIQSGQSLNLTSGQMVQNSSLNSSIVTAQLSNTCSTISACADYTPYGSGICNTDLCNIAQNDPNYLTAKSNGAYGFGCQWNAQTSTCNFAASYQGAGQVFCGNGYTLCGSSLLGLNYCYPGNTCPAGDFPPSDNNGICESTDSCGGSDCNTGNNASCSVQSGVQNLCSNGLCFNNQSAATNVTLCGNGYTLCLSTVKDTTYCYPGGLCPSGDTAAANSCAASLSNTGTCQSGLSCAAGPNGGGECSSSSAYQGQCIYTMTNTGANCTNGLLTYKWNVTWTGSPGNVPSSCADGQNVIECPAQVPLPFFTAGNTIAIIVILVLVYVIVAMAKKKKKAREHANRTQKSPHSSRRSSGKSAAKGRTRKKK